MGRGRGNFLKKVSPPPPQTPPLSLQRFLTGGEVGRQEFRCMGRGRGKRLFFCGTGGKSLQKKVEKGNLENDGPIVRSFVRREGLEGISASARETRAAGRQTANKQRERERTFKKTPEKRHESAGHEMGFARPNRPHPHSRMSLCFGGRPPQHEPVNEKRKPEGLRFLRVGHPANNRYRCFLSNLAGLAASPPPDSLWKNLYRRLLPSCQTGMG